VDSLHPKSRADGEHGAFPRVSPNSRFEHDIALSAAGRGNDKTSTRCTSSMVVRSRARTNPVGSLRAAAFVPFSAYEGSVSYVLSTH
jgi:hypothetical protein